MFKKRQIDLLIAEDDEDDYQLMKEAMEEAQIPYRLWRVRDGEELIDYLLHRNRYEGGLNAPLPKIIFLDLNMPRKDGREALREIKAHQFLQKIPIVVLTTSNDPKDVEESYAAGANSYIHKAVNFNQFIEIFKILKWYWFETVELPSDDPYAVDARRSRSLAANMVH
jgi:CheY-like chemotaxis protein